MDNLLGVILCGGESRRMGRDKGLILIEGVPWARHMADKLAPLGISVIFSINTSQADAYAVHVPSDQLVIDHIDIPGPLNGLLSVHEQFPGKDLLLLACDMVDMDHATIGGLMDAYRTGGPYAYYAYHEEGFYQPFCAIYTAAGLDDAQALSLQGLLAQGKTKRLTISNDEAFRNYNTL